jgi:hypothetical protein
VWVCSITTNNSVFHASLLKCGEFLTAKLHYKEGSWVGLGLIRSCNNEQYLSFIAMLTLSQRLLSDASYFYQTQYEQCVLALYLNLSLINQEKISFSLCFRGRSCEHIIWKPPSPSSRKKIGRFANDCYQLLDMICYCNMGRIIKELLTRGIGGSR